jgi:transposase
MLARFLDDGRIELDTNIVERSLPVMTKAQRIGPVASLIETYKLSGVDPQAYFADVLTKLVNLWPASRLDELMPLAWAPERCTDSFAA